MMGGPVLFEVQDVSKSYDKVSAVNHVSFSLHEGEFLSIIGPSGGGKSTVLKMAAGVIVPTTGSMKFRGEDISTIAAGDHRRVMVWQSLALFPHMNVESNVGFGLTVRRVPRGDRNRRVAESLEMVGLSGYGKRHIQELSGGEQQRVALARALVIQPELILLDEPFGALDVHLRTRLLEKIREIHRTTGLTFMMVTHDQADALYVSTRIAVLSHGQLEQIAAPDEILRRPRTPFVARFVGRKNVFDAVVREVSGSVVTVSSAAGDFSCLVPSWLPAEVHEKMPVVYVIEAHKVEIGTGADNRIKGRFVGRAVDGSRELLEVYIPGLGNTKCERTNMIDLCVAYNDEVSLSWKTSEAYVLPKIHGG
jgi:ABC-type Fe3+/spermidine/putrescine transport system ATPase subunit